MAIAMDPLYRDFGPTLLAEHLERTFGVRVSVETLRNWMLRGRSVGAAAEAGEAPQAAEAAGGVWGELGQWDSSVHRWLEDLAGELVLISIHDDATSRLMMARFVECDDGRRTGGRSSRTCDATAAPRPSTPTTPDTSLRAVAVEEGGADGHDHRAGPGRAGRRGDSGRFSAGEGAGRAELRDGAGPADQGDARGGDRHVRRSEPLSCRVVDAVLERALQGRAA